MKTLVKKCRDYVGLHGKTVLLCQESLHPTLHHYLSSCGITVHTTFGPATTSGLLTANIPKRFCKLGTAGKQLPGVELRLERREVEEVVGEEGQMAVFGRNIVMGFLNREQEVQESQGWLQLDQTATSDGEGFLRVFSSEEGDVRSTVETRVRLELDCVYQCLLIELEEERKGLILSLHCQYDDDGAPTDKLSLDCVKWFNRSNWDVTTVGEVIDNIKQEKGIKHCIQVMRVEESGS